MRILMLGDSFTYFNDLPDLLAKETGAEVVAHTRGGARLIEHLNETTRLGRMTKEALTRENWDYVILQEASEGPVIYKKLFRKSLKSLCDLAREANAKPILFVPWAYLEDSPSLLALNLSYEDMQEKIHASCLEAAIKNQMIFCDVGGAFYETQRKENLYLDDGAHPNLAGSQLACHLLKEAIIKNNN